MHIRIYFVNHLPPSSIFFSPIPIYSVSNKRSAISLVFPTPFNILSRISSAVRIGSIISRKITLPAHTQNFSNILSLSWSENNKNTCIPCKESLHGNHNKPIHAGFSLRRPGSPALFSFITISNLLSIFPRFRSARILSRLAKRRRRAIHDVSHARDRQTAASFPMFVLSASQAR